MKIEITDDIYAALAERVMASNKTLAQVLRDLLGIGEPAPLSVVSPDSKMPNPDEQLLAFSISSEYKMETSAIGKYLLIFGWLYKHEPQKFQLVEKFQRGKRIYFSKSTQAITESGKGVNVKRIPGTDYYAMVTMDNSTKRRVIGELLLAMGYSRELSRKVTETIEDSGITRSHHSLLNEYN